MTKIKIESTGDVLEIKEPTFDVWTRALRDAKEPLTPNDIMGLFINKPGPYIGALPASEGMQIFMTCKPIIDKLYTTMALYTLYQAAQGDQDETDDTRKH